MRSFEAERKADEAADALKREVGADGMFRRNHPWIRDFIGFQFDDAATVKPFLRKDNHGVWKPNLRTKEGKELKKRLQDLPCAYSGDTVGRMFKVKTRIGNRVPTPGIQLIKDGNYLLKVDAECGAPFGCRRISDIEAEALEKESDDAEDKPPV